MADSQMALTFDDGPDDRALASQRREQRGNKNRTERVLNTLELKVSGQLSSCRPKCLIVEAAPDLQTSRQFALSQEPTRDRAHRIKL